jgi:HK97 family phage portal protein
MFGAKTRAVKDPGWTRWASGDGPVPGLSVGDPTQLLTVYGCVTRIADVMSTMPVDHLTRLSGVQREVSPRAGWLDRPNVDTDWASLMVQVVWSWLIDGNVFLAPIRNGFGRVSELWVLDPTRVRLERKMPGQAVAVEVDGRPFAGELIHLPAYLRPGQVRGVNPIENARVALGLGMSAQRYGAGFFDNSAVPAVVLLSKQEMNADQKDDIRNNWNRRHQGKSGGVGVLTGDIAVQQLTIAPEQAQFLETRRFSAAEIAANLFHVPPDMVGVAVDGSSLTYQNMETRWTEFVRSACQPWMTRFERAVSWHLLPRPQYVKFVPDVYLRADTKTRYETHAIGVQGKFLTPNEARELEDRPPLDGGDDFPPAPVAPPT